MGDHDLDLLHRREQQPGEFSLTEGELAAGRNRLGPVGQCEEPDAVIGAEELELRRDA